MADPIGWIYEDDEGRMMFSQMPHPDPLWEPVYRAKREWVGLTDEEIKEILGPWGAEPIKGYTRGLMDKIEAALKAKNA